MPTTPAQAERMQKILKCGEARWYMDLIPPSKTNSGVSFTRAMQVTSKFIDNPHRAFSFVIQKIRLRFYQFSLVDPSSPAAQKYAAEAADWVIGGGSGMVVGRMKFCRDVFRAVFKVNKDLAVNAFQKEKNSFHPIARKLIEKVNRVSSPQFNSDNAPAQDLKLSS
ncbi:uncharacterized protein C8R40DRAFT_1065158 [Lentinula edodes]|uniref:uncharacterized protein n=1 Tax=Lentinula edodes TaxID=5353 RepID=UPI001E8ED6CF|nr:uncharacterized protein C8R40DRAFT_1065158 [Lentinula edodes]KAH7881496.1 hypothetical protein C8R40DRAFT_1065158 [Lentinula edodes]